MNYQEMKQILAKEIAGEIKCDEPMASYTTWRIGGSADLLVTSRSTNDVAKAIKFANQQGIPWLVIGNGSNLLVLDEGIRGMVIQVYKGLDGLAISGQNLKAGAGIMVSRLVREALKENLGGLEFAAGIPATLGGAVYMNAGAHGDSIGNYVEQVTVVNSLGEKQVLNKKELAFSYRYSSLKNQKLVVTEVLLTCPYVDQRLSRQTIQQQLAKRKESQPLSMPNAGSVFKNPPGLSAGRLIEESGGKGLRVGDAEVSHKHANFIVNLGQAKARDVLTLIEKIQNLVMQKLGIQLELEVIVVGE